MSTNKRSAEQLRLLRDEALEAYLNREDFRYDLNADALYQQYKDRYVQMGRDAMQDTMGQAAALTGGYGSSYAQNVGQQAYQNYLLQLGDVMPELYQLAYDRYRDRGDALYKTYQSWSQLEQEAAQRERQDREYDLAYKEYELAEQKRKDDMTRFYLEQEYKESQNQQDDQKSDEPNGAYYAWLAYHQGQGERSDSNDPTRVTKYDNQDVSTGDIMTMQRVLGREETGMWTIHDRKSAGGMTANKAWEAYRKGQLQNRTSPGLGDQGLPNSNVKLMERVLGLNEDGYWSEEDKKAAGGLSEAEAWEAYQRGLLQNWR